MGGVGGVIDPRALDASGGARPSDLLALAVFTRQPPPGQRAVGQHAHAVAQAGRQHVVFDRAGQQRVGGLLGPKPCVPRRSAVHWASTICEAGTFDAPKERILPAWTRSDRAPRVSSRSVPGSGTPTWYRSIQSVCSRRSEPSTASVIHRRDAPRWLGSSSPKGTPNLTASTTPSRRPPASAWPRISSDSPAE